jgi:hypothetical protein
MDLADGRDYLLAHPQNGQPVRCVRSGYAPARAVMEMINWINSEGPSLAVPAPLAYWPAAGKLGPQGERPVWCKKSARPAGAGGSAKPRAQP